MFLFREYFTMFLFREYRYFIMFLFRELHRVLV